MSSWTYETDCTSGNAQDPLPIFYDPASSSTSDQIDDSSWSAGYGNGAFRKNLSAIYMDKVVFGTISVPRQAIGRPQQPCSTAKDQVTQGLVGLGYGQWPNGRFCVVISPGSSVLMEGSPSAPKHFLHKSCPYTEIASFYSVSQLSKTRFL